MELEKDNEAIEKISLKKCWSLNDFHKWTQQKFPLIKETKYFIELSVISDYLMLLSLFSLEKISSLRGFEFLANKKQIDQQLHVIQNSIKVDNLQIYTKILLIQMDRIIKVCFQYWDQNQQKFHKYAKLSFDHTTYLNKKISNSYKLHSLKELNLNETKKQSQLNYLYLSRNIQSFLMSLQHSKIYSQKFIQSSKIFKPLDFMKFFNTQQKLQTAELFIQALANPVNLIKIASYLDLASIVRLSRANSLINKYYFNPENIFYKNLYEQCFGRTGFDLNQLDWKKSFAKKRSQKSKISSTKKQNIIGSSLFRTH